ncbi:DsbA family oxidoreductase [Allosphingosinicella deserti]|uniref:Disulfide bond formation protein DsbA n=1 Tax=Allosphingosinicella deserti TaxID=2116704 RepID=A0A2P7QKE8_9SPHN|nr:DsbA family oxidoreductase [Sphingomonas deserti]PSJ38449.1 disulfide bond formation protein DsbA [Sphingomonas deserti]
MSRTLTIDFVSDVVCPWCVIGLRGLEIALERLQGEVDAQIRFHPFELNPDIAAEGENIVDHIGRKYGSTPEQSAINRATIRARAGDVGFAIAMSDESRIYNTFDAHRLLHWAGLEGRQQALEHALFAAYFSNGLNPADFAILVAAAGEAGLDRARAAEVLQSGLYADEVRAGERLWQSRGISAVPAVIVNERYLISGGQPPEAFEQALRNIAAEA